MKKFLKDAVGKVTKHASEIHKRGSEQTTKTADFVAEQAIPAAYVSNKAARARDQVYWWSWKKGLDGADAIGQGVKTAGANAAANTKALGSLLGYGAKAGGSLLVGGAKGMYKGGAWAISGSAREIGKASSKVKDMRFNPLRLFRSAEKNIKNNASSMFEKGHKDAWKDPKIKKQVAKEVRKAVKEQSKGMATSAIQDALNPKMSFTKKAVIGGGAVAGGVLGYNALAGGGAANASTFAEAENAGAQAAIRDAMAEGYGPVMMGAPMPQVQAANLNYEGPMMSAQLARG
jgi:hypothetical protein